MAKIFLIHGAFGSPDENWFPWLKQELEKLGHEVIVPKFPTPEEQTLENWYDVFEGYKKEIDENSIMVGHSLGPAFILSVLEDINVSIKEAFFVSGFIKFLGNESFDYINKTFVEKEFDWDKIKQNCSNFFVYHSDNDPYVPLECSNQLAAQLDVEPKIIEQAGHFNADSGYDKFEKLLEDIKSVI